jgi:uncharacterized protein YjiS (DUF1127 family)
MIMQTQNIHSRPEDGLAGDVQADAERLAAFRSLFGWLFDALRAVTEERGHRRAIRELRRFDRQMLADIGVKPGEIEHAVRHGRRGRGW